MRGRPVLRENTTMKCPICGHHLARLADPCLHCAEVLSGCRTAKTDPAPALAAPTSLTLPAELRVPAAAASALPTRPTPDHIKPVPAPPLSWPHAPPGRSPVIGVAGLAPSSPAIDAPSVSAASPRAAAAVSVAVAPGGNAASSAIRPWAAVGIALLALGAYLGSRTASDPVRDAPTARSVSASNDAAVSPPAATALSLPVATVRAPAAASVRPARTASAATLSIAAVARPKPQVAKQAAVALPVAPSSPPVASTGVAAPPRTVVEAVRPIAPEPTANDLREACGNRGFIANALCVNERCAQAAFGSHPECVELRKAADDAEQTQSRGG